MPAPRSRLFSLLALAALVPACAPPGPYPSLAPRPIEKALAGSDEEPVPAPIADDAALPARIAALEAEARRGHGEFEAALPAARAAVERAGPAESDSWVGAQQALSRAEAARAVTVRALADLDALALREAAARTLNEADLARLEAATAGLQAIADRQHEQLARLKAQLAPI